MQGVTVSQGCTGEAGAPPGTSLLARPIGLGWLWQPAAYRRLVATTIRRISTPGCPLWAKCRRRETCGHGTPLNQCRIGQSGSKTFRIPVMHMQMHVHNAVMRQSEPTSAARSARRLPACSWLYVPAASGPIGGGLIKLGHGDTAAAVTVAVAPYAVCALLYTVFVVGYLGALVRYLCAGTAGQHAMERLIA